MITIWDAVTTTADQDAFECEVELSSDRIAAPAASATFVRVVIGLGTTTMRATVDPVAAERKARIKALNAAIKAGYVEPSVSTH